MRIGVTGAASGIGAEICTVLLSQGHEIVGFDVQRISDKRIKSVEVDMADAGSITRAIDALDGPFDGLINAAGLPPRDGNAALVLAVNFLGLRQFTTRFLPLLGAGSSVVNIGSRAGVQWRKDGAAVAKNLIALTEIAQAEAFCVRHKITPLRAYELSKEAVVAWTKTMTEDLITRDLRMNTLSPAAVSTKLLDDFETAIGADVVAQNARKTGRMARVEDIAPVAAFLVSPQSGWIKGVNLELDGGLGAMSESAELGLAGPSGST